MTVLFYSDWEYGTDNGTTYTMATPEMPNGHSVDIGTSTIASEAGSPWNGQYLLDISAHWANGARWQSLTSSHVNANAGRILIEFTTAGLTTSNQIWKIEHAAAQLYFRITSTINAGNTWRNYFDWDNGAKSAEYAITWPSLTNPIRLEMIYDKNASTIAECFKVRYWDVGSSPGSFNNSNITSGTPGGTTNQPTDINWAVRESGNFNGKCGKIVISDDPTEDLSTWSPSAGGILLPTRRSTQRNTLLRI